MRLRGYLFLKLLTAKIRVSYMHKKPRVRTPMDSKHVKGSKGCNYLQIKKHFLNFLLHFQNLHKSWILRQKKNETPRLFGSEIIDCKKRSYLNAQKTLCQDTYGQSTS